MTVASETLSKSHRLREAIARTLSHSFAGTPPFVGSGE